MTHSLTDQQVNDLIERDLSQYVDAILFFNEHGETGLVYGYRFKLKMIRLRLERSLEFDRRPIGTLPKLNYRNGLGERGAEDLRTDADRVLTIAKTFVQKQGDCASLAQLHNKLRDLLKEVAGYRDEIKRPRDTHFPFVPKESTTIPCPIESQSGWQEKWYITPRRKRRFCR